MSDTPPCCRDAAEIAKLERERSSLMAQLSSRMTPHEHKLKYVPQKMPAQHQAVLRKKMDVKQLADEKVALMKKLEGYRKESKSDPVVGGILAQYATDSGIGTLGEVKDTKDNVMGSLLSVGDAAHKSRRQRFHLLKMMAESMGDVSPKEALAQRVISIGSKYAKGGQQLVQKGGKHMDWIQPLMQKTMAGELETEVQKAKRVEEIEDELRSARKSLKEETARSPTLPSPYLSPARSAAAAAAPSPPSPPPSSTSIVCDPWTPACLCAHTHCKTPSSHT